MAKTMTEADPKNDTLLAYVWRRGAAFLDRSSKWALLVAVAAWGYDYVIMRPQRDRIAQVQSIYQAWQVINTASGKSGDGGRLQALRNLNEAKQALHGANLDGLTVTSEEGLKVLEMLCHLDNESLRLDNISLKGAILRTSNGRGVDLHGVRVRNLRGADLTKANLSGAKLAGADLTKANLSGAKLAGADLSKANLSGAKLAGANLSEADLRGANLSNSNLRCADLRNAELFDANLSYADLFGANLSNAHLRNADLHNADLQEANLRKADVLGVILGNANLTLVRVGIRDWIQIQEAYGLGQWEMGPREFVDEEGKSYYLIRGKVSYP